MLDLELKEQHTARDVIIKWTKSLASQRVSISSNNSSINIANSPLCSGIKQVYRLRIVLQPTYSGIGRGCRSEKIVSAWFHTIRMFSLDNI
jgi:hypothetical protein